MYLSCTSVERIYCFCGFCAVVESTTCAFQQRHRFDSLESCQPNCLHAILIDEVTSSSAANPGRSPADVDLSVAIGALRFRNPILAASGTFGYGLESAHLVDLNRLGGLVTKGVTASIGTVRGDGYRLLHFRAANMPATCAFKISCSDCWPRR